MPAQLEFPLQFKRQYDAPLDADMVFETQEALNNYLTNPLRYAGQVSTCLTNEGVLYVLNNEKDTWITIDTSGNTIIFNTTELLNAYLSNDARYAGQIVSCLATEGILYILNNALTEWIVINSIPTNVFETTVLLTSYLSNNDRYAGQIVTCLETPGIIYILDNAMTSWYEVISDHSNIVHKSGEETITGLKTFTNNLKLGSQISTVDNDGLLFTVVTDDDKLKYAVSIDATIVDALARCFPELIESQTDKIINLSDYNIVINVQDSNGDPLILASTNVTLKYHVIEEDHLLYIHDDVNVIVEGIGSAQLIIPVFENKTISGVKDPVFKSDVVPKNHLDITINALSTALSLLINAKESAITKNTAFNKDFGTTEGTVADGLALATLAETLTNTILSDIKDIPAYTDNDKKVLQLKWNPIDGETPGFWSWEYVLPVIQSDLVIAEATDTSDTTVFSSKQTESRFAEGVVIILTDADAGCILLAGREYIISSLVTIDLELSAPVVNVSSVAVSNKSIVSQTIVNIGILSESVPCSLYCTNNDKVTPEWAEFTTNLL